MKKATKLLTLALLSGVLASCDLPFFKKDQKPEEGKKKVWDIEVDISGGSEEEKNALLSAINGSIVTKNAKDAIYPDSTVALSEDDGDYLRLVSEYTKKGFTTKIEWEVDESDYYNGLVENGNAYNLYPVYKGWEHKNDSDAYITFSMKSVTCGEAVASAPNVSYKVDIKNEQYHKNNITIAEINKVTDQEKIVVAGDTTYKYPSTFDMVNYEYTSGEKYSPYFKKDELNAGMEKDYYYCRVKGKVIYYAPDGNFALLADGDQILEFYAGSSDGTPLTPTNFPAMNDEYVEVTGNLSQYCGNIQLGFVTNIRSLTDAEKATVTEPTMNYKTLDFSKFVLPAEYTCQKQAIDGFSNSLAQVSGTVVAGSLKDRDGKSVSSADSLDNNRFTFELLLSGGNKITVAYDYHTDKDGSHGVFSALKAAYKNTGTVTIKGSMRYSGNDSAPFVLAGNTGVWNIVPFLADHAA